MGKPAARIGDMHTCPMVTPGTPPIPHVGGPVTGPAVPTVLIGGMPAAVMGDMCVCVGPPDTIIMGSVGVFIGGKPAARMGDPTVHGGMIAIGCPTVLIGEAAPGSPPPPVLPLPMKVALAQMGSAGATASQLLTMKNAAKKGVPFCEKCAQAANSSATSPPTKPNTQSGNSYSSKSNSNPANTFKSADPVNSATTWDKYTNIRVQNLEVDLKVKATNFINAVEQELSIKLRITQALRTFAEQDALYAKGRTVPGSIVTKAKGGDSYHNYGLAFDVAIVENGGVSYNITPEIAAIGARYGLEWGGNWTSFKDKPHFQDTKGQSITQLKKK